MTLEDTEKTRKRLIFRSWHRGTREMDLIMGRFADAHVPGFSTDELAQYDEILGHNDPDLYDWIARGVHPPANLMNAVLITLIQSFKI